MPTVPVLHDNPPIAPAPATLLGLPDIDVRAAACPAEGLDVVDAGGIDLVIQDMNFHADTTSGEEGIALFHALRARDADLPVVLLTAWTHLDTAVELVKAGAADYLGKPWDDRKLLATVHTLLELGEARRELARGRAHGRQRRRALADGFDLAGMVFADPASEAAIALACQVARSDLPVLITGPNGAGKERYADVIHRNSAVRDGPFVALNCGALPAELVEAELFGAEAGAYTGATRAREGKFEAADGGTLFLDEIGTLPAAGQVKLLRVLETGRFQRLGSNREREVRVRVLSATNADLPECIARGMFREDLYYRLNAIEVRVPALAQRPDDILPLARHYLPPGRTFDAGAEAALLAHPWPGNVRELRHVVQRGALLGRGEAVTAGDLGLRAPARAQAPAAEPDRDAIEAALARNGHVIAQAAADLGLSRQALYRRMERLGLGRG